uniref:MCM9 N-terminal domain-containing protein n=1 Tax=Pavo cristatus TaxID=9049 RepID=A0A8C9G369_PAVCR
MALRADQVSLTGQVFESYLLQHHRDDILGILRQGDDEAHYPVLVDALTLFETNMEIGEYFNAFPSQVLPIFDGALRRAAMEVLQAAMPSAELRMKPNLHARISEWSLLMDFIVFSLQVHMPLFLTVRKTSVAWL